RSRQSRPLLRRGPLSRLLAAPARCGARRTLSFMSGAGVRRFAPPAGAFTVTLPIRFSQCDPAGIVYFPHYFDLVHACLEDWYEQVLGFGFTKLVGSGHGAPIVHAECDFTAPSRMGDRVQLTLLVERLGRASVTYRFVGHPDNYE